MPVTGMRRRLGGLLALVVLALSSATPAAGQSDPALTVATTATYRADVDAGRIEVEFGYAFENTTAATAFPGFFESLPVGATDVQASDRSGALPAGSGEEADGFAIWLIAFRAPLDPGDRLDVTLRFSIDGGGATAAALVEPGAIAFDAYVPGPGDATPTPPVYEVPAGFSPVSATAPAQPYDLVRVEYVNHEAFGSTITTLPPQLTISDWEVDSDWSRAVRDRSSAVVGSLDTWFGPRDEAIEVRRAFPADSHARTGDGLVELARDDAESIDHQLAHLWLADVPVDEAWFIEGLAAAFAGDRPDPPGAADVVPVIVNEIGAAGVRSIVDALRAEAITYPGVVAEAQPLPPDWRTLLDHFERVADTDGVDALFRDQVIAPEDAPLLDRRATARADYDALVARAGGWTLPPYLRLAMAMWDFDAFASAQGEVSDVIVRRDALRAWAESLELPARDDAETAFESAGDGMDAVNDLLDDKEEALGAFDEAERLVNGDRGLLATIGLLGHDVDHDLETLRQAWVDGDYTTVVHDGHELAVLVEGAVGDGTIRLLLPALGLLGVWQLLRLARRRLTAGRDARPGQP